MKKQNFELSSENMQNLESYSTILQKDISTIMNEALQDYFANEQKKLLEKNLENENAMTNLGYDEFWDGVELE